MHLVELTLLSCESGHDYYIPNEEEVNLDELQCPFCGESVATEASRTVLMASSGRDTMKMYEEYGGGKHE